MVVILVRWQLGRGMVEATTARWVNFPVAAFQLDITTVSQPVTPLSLVPFSPTVSRTKWRRVSSRSYFSTVYSLPVIHGK